VFNNKALERLKAWKVDSMPPFNIAAAAGMTAGCMTIQRKS